jgi:hypothetical protein
MRLQKRIWDVGAVGDELHSMLSGKHPFQRRRQQSDVGLAGSGVFCYRALETDQLCSLKIDQGKISRAAALGALGL